jgi:methionyl-tRNA formyltransferase
VALRLVMMGTGEFALPSFLALCDSEHELVGLFTQPDRVGRGHHAHPHPMKDAALERGVPVFQPENINTPRDVESLRGLNPDLLVVAAYGQILKPPVLESARLGAINIHASLLPRYRGAAPIHHAIRAGERETGITIFQIEPRLDAGPILMMQPEPIGPEETSGEVHDRLAARAVPLILQVVRQLELGTATPVPQPRLAPSLAPKMEKSSGIIDWSLSALRIHDHIRAMTPWPRAFTWVRHAGEEPRRLIVHRSFVLDETRSQPPGTIVTADNHQLMVQTGEGLLQLLEVQPEGKRRMSIEDFLHGHPLQPGDVFETPA